MLHEEQPELEEFIQLHIQNFSANESALFFSSIFYVESDPFIGTHLIAKKMSEFVSMIQTILVSRKMQGR